METSRKVFLADVEMRLRRMRKKLLSIKEKSIVVDSCLDDIALMLLAVHKEKVSRPLKVCFAVDDPIDGIGWEWIDRDEIGSDGWE